MTTTKRIWRDGKKLARNDARSIAAGVGGGLTRRAFARTLGVGALALPFLRTLQTKAQPTTAPKRFLVFFSPNGTIPDQWIPNGGETDFTGSAGGALRTGRFHRYDRPHNDLWLTMLRAFGIEDESFGDTRFQTGVIDNLLA